MRLQYKLFFFVFFVWIAVKPLLSYYSSLSLKYPDIFASFPNKNMKYKSWVFMAFYAEILPDSLLVMVN